MARTSSNMLALGTPAPNFNLQDTNSAYNFTFNQIQGEKGTLIIFICNHCPYVLLVIDEIVRIANDYRIQGIGIAAISSNDINKYPQDHPDLMTEFAYHNKIDFPYLYDKTQEVAIAYQAACTPEFYLFDAQNKLIYRGQLDESRPQNGIPVSGTDLRNAIDSLLYNRQINPIQKPSMGCGIKWI